MSTDDKAPEMCAALVWRGSRWGNNPEPDEFCGNDAVEGSDYCEQHTEPEDDL